MLHKILSTILFMILFQIVCAQCNKSALQKRQIYKSETQKERVIAIRLTTRISALLINDINKKGGQVGNYIKDAISRGKKPNLAYYIGVLKNEKLKIEAYKQMKETNHLDELTYCYLDFELKFYNNLQDIIIRNTVDNIMSEMSKVKDSFIVKEDAMIDELNRTIKTIETLYPIKVTNQ